MKLFCGSDLSEQTSDTLYQFEEGKRAHTIKFIPYQSEKQTNINSLNNNKIYKSPLEHKSKNINNELILSKEKNKLLKEPNKCSNEISELEIIDYPIDEIKKNDYKDNNSIFRAKTNNNFNDKCQNNIINYLKCKPGYNHFNFALDDDYSSLNSNSEDKYNIKDDSSKSSDEIICSYVEIDNSKALVKRAQKENNVIKNTSKIFSQIHKATHSNHSLSLKFNNNSCNNKKTKKNIKTNSKLKETSIERKINNLKKIKNYNDNDKVINKLVINKKIIQHKKSFNSNEHLKNFHKILDTNKSPNNKSQNFTSFKAFNSFRTIDYKRNTSPSNRTLIKEKSNIKARKTHKLNTERLKNYIHVNRTITLNSNNKINSNDKNKNKIKINTNTQIFKTIKGISNMSNLNKINKTKKINNINKLMQKSNTLFNSLDNNKSKNLKKSNFLFSKKELNNPKLKVKKRNPEINAINFDSKGKLRKLLLNKKSNNINKPKIDISLNNIYNNIYSNMNLIIRREKYITENKLLNKSEANKELNNRNKNNNKDNKNKK